MTTEAIKGSIKKWEEIRDGKRHDSGHSDCPLCQVYYMGNNDCDGCPVKEKTGKSNCRNTPYVDYCRASNLGEKVDTAAQAEIDFLTSLLPKESVTEVRGFQDQRGMLHGNKEDAVASNIREIDVLFSDSFELSKWIVANRKKIIEYLSELN